MELTRIVSSNIHSCGYDPEAQALEVCFVTRNGDAGNRYRYAGVPKEVFDGLISSASAGQYFATTIKDNYPTERV